MQKDNLLAALIYYSQNKNSDPNSLLRYGLGYEVSEDIIRTYDDIGIQIMTALIIGDRDYLINCKPRPSIMRYVYGITSKYDKVLTLYYNSFKCEYDNGVITPSSPQIVVLQMFNNQMRELGRLCLPRDQIIVHPHTYFMKIWELHKAYQVYRDHLALFSKLVTLKNGQVISSVPSNRIRLRIPGIYDTEIGVITLT